MTGIIATGVLLLVLLALHVWSERVARRKGRTPASQERSAWIVTAAVIVTLVAGNHFVWPELVQRFRHFTFESQLATYPYFAALKEHYPGEYQRFLDEFQEKAAGQELDGAGLVQLSAGTMNLLQARLPHASDEAAAMYSTLIVRQLRELSAISPEMCYFHLFPDQTGKVLPAQQLSRETRHAAQLAMAAVIRSSAGEGHAVPEAVDALPALESVLLPLEVKHGDDWLLLQDPQAEGVDKGKVCNVMRDLFEGIEALPPEREGKVLRYMFSLD